MTAGPMPEPGTLRYQRLVVQACSAQTQGEFNEEMFGLWDEYGWPFGVDVQVELLVAFRRSYPVFRDMHPRDLFGKIPLSKFVPGHTKEERLRYAVQAAEHETAQEGLAPHEAFRESLHNGERMWAIRDNLLPFWQRALNTLDSGGSREEVRAVVLSSAPARLDDEERSDRHALATAFFHGSIRQFALPPGRGWVDVYVKDQGRDPLVQGGRGSSFAAHAWMDPKMESDSLPDWWRKRMGGQPPKKRRMKGKRHCRCGGQH